MSWWWLSVIPTGAFLYVLWGAWLDLRDQDRDSQ